MASLKSSSDNINTVAQNVGLSGRLLAANTLLPGVLVLLLSWLYANWNNIQSTKHGKHSDAVLAFIVQETEHVNAFTAAFLLMAMFAGACAIGCTCCAATWVCWFFVRHLIPHPNGAALYGSVRRLSGVPQVRAVLARHPALEKALNSPIRKWAIDTPDKFVLEYCKGWLRKESPTSGVDHFELEINLLLGLVIPVALGGFFAVHTGVPIYVGLPAAAIIIVGLGAAAMHRQRQELRHALRNFMFEQFYATAAATTQVAEAPTETPHTWVARSVNTTRAGSVRP